MEAIKEHLNASGAVGHDILWSGSGSIEDEQRTPKSAAGTLREQQIRKEATTRETVNWRSQ